MGARPQAHRCSTRRNVKDVPASRARWRTGFLEEEGFMTRSGIVALAILAAACGGDRTLAPGDPAFDVIEGACPSGFDLVSGSSASDHNGDGYYCAMSFENGTGETQTVEIDNNIPADQIGSCPANFKTQPVLSGNPIDRNGNGIICWYLRPGSETPIQIDDNTRA
jgi:hypothetical protein